MFFPFRPPNVQQALDGHIPFSYNSNERLFLRQFVNCTPGTPGGRLARWLQVNILFEKIIFYFEMTIIFFAKLQPESFIDVDQCEVHINSDDLKCNWPTIINITTHDQYGDVVQVPDLKVS